MAFPQGLTPVADLSQTIQMGIWTGTYTRLVAAYAATSSTSSKVIRATTYTAQTSGAQRSFNSTSTKDASGNTGALTVVVTYLNSSLTSYETETVTMNGTTAVNTVNTDYCFIESIQVATVGSDGANDGTIQIWSSTGAGGSVWGSIAVSDNQTYWAHHYVLNGGYCGVTSVNGGSTAVSGCLTLMRTGNPISTNLPQQAISGTYIHGYYGSGVSVDHEFQNIALVVGPDMIMLSEKPSAATASTIYASFELFQF
jgi:hypothetical protein